LLKQAIGTLRQADIPLENREYKDDVKDRHVRREKGRCWHRQIRQANTAAEPEKQKDTDLLRREFADGISVGQQDPEGPEGNERLASLAPRRLSFAATRSLAGAQCPAPLV
jgi:hypothetical protein